jgi:hypothetical protein
MTTLIDAMTTAKIVLVFAAMVVSNQSTRPSGPRRSGLLDGGSRAGAVASRSDAEMLRMMADENRDEFKHDALVAVETVGQVIGA